MKVADMHCDTILKIYDSKKAGAYQGLEKNDFQIDRQKLIAGDYLVQNFAVFIELDQVKNPYQTAKEMIACFDEEMQLNQGWIAPAKSFQDILNNQAAGLISGVLTMEEGAPIEGDVSKLQEFYNLGVRMLTLTWNFENQIGFPNAAFSNEEGVLLTDKQKGLTKKGIEIVEAMTELGMIIDVSHGSDQLVKDVLMYTKVPFVASHSNARQLRNHVRNLSDDLIKAIANRGGVIGMNYFEEFLREGQSTTHLLDVLVEHISYFKNVGGIDCIGLGSDFDGIRVNEQIHDASYLPKLSEKLSQAHFTSTEIEKIFSKNVLRLYQELL